jgi:hypothetical protein
MVSRQSQAVAKQTHDVQPAKPNRPAPIHRKSSNPRMGNQTVQRLLRDGVIQAKLTINQPGDRFEQEADQVAEEVMHMPAPQALERAAISGLASPTRIHRTCGQCEEGLGSRPVAIQRLCPECEEELHRQPMEEEEEKLLQTKTTGRRRASGKEGGSEAPLIVNEVLRLPGQPLDMATRAFMESRFGHDFSGVRVHTDAKASESAQAVNAIAYTVGRNVVFGASQYTPQTNAGQRLIAHELTHVVQQTSGLQKATPMTSSIEIGKPGDTFEREADRVADQVASGTDKVPHNLVVSSPSIQRTCDPSAIIAMAPPSCSVGDHTFVPGRLFKFNKDCDDFAPTEEAALIAFASALPPTTTLEIHSYASVDTATFNEQLSCARSSKAQSVLTAFPPTGAGIAASRITTVVNHGPTPGPAAERRSVVIRTSTPTPTPTPIPTPTPTPAPAFRCGPNVSSQVRAAVAKVISAWGGWSSSKRDDQCDALDSRSLAKVAWDIVNLHRQAWIVGYQPTCATAGASPPCHNSVEVDSNCYYAGSANYVIFGTMCKLCDAHLGWTWHTPVLGWLDGFPEWYMQYLITLYKGGALPGQTAAPNYGPSLLWATAGYRGWPSGGTPPPGDRPVCTTGCSTLYGGTPFDVNWYPHGII